MVWTDFIVVIALASCLLFFPVLALIIICVSKMHTACVPIVPVVRETWQETYGVGCCTECCRIFGFIVLVIAFVTWIGSIALSFIFCLDKGTEDTVCITFLASVRSIFSFFWLISARK